MQVTLNCTSLFIWGKFILELLFHTTNDGAGRRFNHNLLTRHITTAGTSIATRTGTSTEFANSLDDLGAGAVSDVHDKLSLRTAALSGTNVRLWRKFLNSQ